MALSTGAFDTNKRGNNNKPFFSHTLMPGANYMGGKRSENKLRLWITIRFTCAGIQ